MSDFPVYHPLQIPAANFQPATPLATHFFNAMAPAMELEKYKLAQQQEQQQLKINDLALKINEEKLKAAKQIAAIKEQEIEKQRVAELELSQRIKDGESPLDAFIGITFKYGDIKDKKDAIVALTKQITEAQKNNNFAASAELFNKLTGSKYTPGDMAKLKVVPADRGRRLIAFNTETDQWESKDVRTPEELQRESEEFESKQQLTAARTTQALEAAGASRSRAKVSEQTAAIKERELKTLASGEPKSLKKSKTFSQLKTQKSVIEKRLASPKLDKVFDPKERNKLTEKYNRDIEIISGVVEEHNKEVQNSNLSLTEKKLLTISGDQPVIEPKPKQQDVSPTSALPYAEVLKNYERKKRERREEQSYMPPMESLLE